MISSLRVRLLFWYTLILVLVAVVFGGTVCWLFWRSSMRDLDAELLTQARSLSRVVTPAGDGTFNLDLPEELAQYFQRQPDGPYYAIWSPGGVLIDRSAPEVEALQPGTPGVRTSARGRETSIGGPDGIVVLVGADLTTVRQELWSLAWTVSGVGIFALLLSLLGGWFLTGRALAPVERISRTARAMSDGDLTARVAVDATESELGQLASTLNGAFDRLGEMLQQQQRFTADASHELRTPLAALSAELEWALGRERTPSEYRESLETCARAVARMADVVEALLLLARADAGESDRRRAAVSIEPLVRESVEALRPVAAKKAVALDMTGLPNPVEAWADAGLLRQAISNVVSNAIRYNVEGGHVRIALSESDTSVAVTVVDTGPGISAADLPRIFDRFYRAEAARTRAAGGAGLGLAVARWVVEDHGGTIVCSSEAGRGAEFVIELPRYTVTAPSSE